MKKYQNEVRWYRVVEKTWRVEQADMMSTDERGGYETKIREMIGMRGEQLQKQSVDDEEHLKKKGGLGEGIGTEVQYICTAQ